MKQRMSMTVFSAMIALALMVTVTAVAGPPEAPWRFHDIGEPSVPGSTDVGAADVWTIKGSGAIGLAPADSFQFAYQALKGDGSIMARLLNQSGGDSTWAHSGLMIRQDDTPGSPHVSYAMTPGRGLHAVARFAPDEESVDFTQVGPVGSGQRNLFMRLQRVGQEVAGFYSRDGVLWSQAGFSPQPLSTLPQEALFGLAVTSFQQRGLTTAQFDQVHVQSAVAQPNAISAHGVQACGGDRTVLLQWRPLAQARGFYLYRGAAGATADQLVKLNDKLITGTQYADTSEGLANDTPMTYAVAPVFTNADGQEVPGPLVAVPVTPARVLPGWLGCSINESNPGSGTFDAATGEITIHGTGEDIWVAADHFYFLNQLVEGDAQITVKALTKPTASHGWAKAGLMIRESLDGSARMADLFLTPANGMNFQYRPTANGNAEWPGASVITAAALKPPITLRFTRRGRTVTPEFSTDDGKTFRPAGEPLTFDRDLPRSVYMGLAITSSVVGQSSQAKFKDLVVTQLP